MRFPSPPVLRLSVAVLLLMPATAPRAARANAYDAVAGMLAPILNPFLESPKRPETAMRGTLVLESGRAGERDAAPPGSAELRFALERPDRFRAEGSLGGVTVTVGRSGDRCWALPGDPVREWIGRLPPAREPRAGFGPMRLPVTDTQAVFLPALLSVRELERSVFRGQPCRVLDLSLMPELARAAGADAWSARLWLHQEDLRPARIGVRGPGFAGVARVEELQYLRSLPPETWAVPEGAAEISPGRLLQLVSALVGRANAEPRSKTPAPPAP